MCRDFSIFEIETTFKTADRPHRVRKSVFNLFLQKKTLKSALTGPQLLQKQLFTSFYRLWDRVGTSKGRYRCKLNNSNG